MAGRFGFVVFEGVPQDVLDEAYAEVRSIAERTGYGRQIRIHGQPVEDGESSVSGPSIVEISSDESSDEDDQ
jgi:hypothetical protein